MASILIFSIFWIVVFSLLYSLWRQRKARRDSVLQPPPPPPDPALFAPDPMEIAELRAEAERNTAAVREADWLYRARAGELDVLREINPRVNRPAYDAALSALVQRIGDASFADLSVLSGFLIDHNLPASRALMSAVAAHCQTSPDRSSAIMLLHIAARTDSADAFAEAFDLLATAGVERKLPALSSNELMTLAESEFWLLSDTQRNSGAGFLLKQKLAGARRELAAAAREGNANPQR
jgi:hypothetical protein